MKYIIACALSLCTFSAVAGTQDALRATLDLQEVGYFSSIEKMEVIATYRCPDCFDIVVTGEKVGFVNGSREEAVLFVRTHRDLQSGLVSAEVTGGTK
jgi:hypothetical protein